MSGSKAAVDGAPDLEAQNDGGSSLGEAGSGASVNGIHTPAPVDTASLSEPTDSSAAAPTNAVAPSDDEPEAKKLSEEAQANCVSRILFGWSSGVFFKRFHRARKFKKEDPDPELQVDEFWTMPDNDSAARIENDFRRYYESPKYVSYTPEKRFNCAMYDLVFWDMFWAGWIKLVNTGLQFAYPLLLRQLLFVLQPNSGLPLHNAYGWGAGLGLAIILKALTENTYFFRVARAGWTLRVAITTSVYRKSLRLSNSARQSKTLGEIVNLMALDAGKIERFTEQAHVLWDSWVQIIGYTMIVYSFVEWSAFVGLGFMLCMVPLQGLVFKTLIGLDRKSIAKTDIRVKVTNEALQGMSGVKSSAWEEPFGERITSVRKEEVSYLKGSVKMRSFSTSYMAALPVITSVVVIAVYASAQNGVISPSILFATISALGQLRFPLMFLPMALGLLSQAKVSITRISGFLDMEVSVAGELAAAEVDAAIASPTVKPSQLPSTPTPGEARADSKPNSETGLRRLPPDSEYSLVLENVNAYWANPDVVMRKATEVPVKKVKRSRRFGRKKAVKETPEVTAAPSIRVPYPILTGMDFSVKRGELIAVVGSVAVGKSALINTMLGETHIGQGKVSMDYPVAFASQTPVVFNATIRDNILFGEPYDQERYEDVIASCQLEHDLTLFADGDMTEIGERGVSLSGGQKQRVAVARAAYSRAQLVILDDPLSALDPEVAVKLFEECIIDTMQGRSRVIVTNHLSILNRCDRILVLKSEGDGKTSRIAELGAYDDLIANKGEFSELMTRYKGATAEYEGEADDAKSKQLKRQPSSVRRKAKLVGSLGASTIMRAEERAKGTVSGFVYNAFLDSGGGKCVFFGVIVLYMASMMAAWSNSYMITLWTEDAVVNYPSHGLGFWLGMYALTAILLGITAFLRTLGLYSFCINSTTVLHRNMLDAVLHAPMAYFDTTPTGRILQRFSKDIQALDYDLPENMSFLLFTSMFVLVSLGTVIGVTPIFAAFLPPMILIYGGYLVLYRPVMRDAKRLNSIVTSPVYAHFSETLGGLLVIRSFGRSADFMDKENTLVDSSTRMGYAVKVCERWLGVRLELMGASASLVAAELSVLGVEKGWINASEAGLSISFAMALTMMLTATIRSFAAVEAAMNSVERTYFMQSIAQEKRRKEDYEDGFETVSDSWPAEGAVTIKDLSMKYRSDTPMVLQSVSFQVNAGERIGVVGRTGSGKSSLLVCLLRLVEPLPGSSITIDGKDILRVPLPTLRTRIGIVPQLPVLFSGTIRYNVDPFGKYDDASIWDALDRVGLKSSFQTLEKGLDSPVSEFGENLSQGERGLLSIARTLLKNPKVLLLDEATASLDQDSDARVQSVLRSSFVNVTMIVIAHRLRTIVDSSRILVLGPGGRVLEYDSPDRLMSDANSTLSAVIAELDQGEVKMLRQQASSSAILRGETPKP